MTDYTWKGPPADIGAVIYDAGTTNTKAGLDIIGPRTLDGISYVNIKTEQSLNIPSTCSETGVELSAALLGVWYSAAAEEVLKQSEVDNTKN